MTFIQSLFHRLPVPWGAVILVMAGVWSAKAAEDGARNVANFNQRAVSVIPPGTIVGEDNSNGWNRLVLLAKPRLAAGAVEEVPSMAGDLATRFSVVIMARVAGQAQNGEVKYRLEGVGVGFGTEIDGKNVVVSSEKHEKLGADLNTFERLVLAQNEKTLQKTAQIARSRHFAIFDVRGRLLHANKPREVKIRHLVWVGPETGKIASVMWPLIERPNGQYQLLGETLIAIPGGFQEDRRIHVSADQVTFGIPSSQAFALTRMPPGKKIAATRQFKSLAARKKYAPASFSQLIDAVRKAF